MNKLLICITLLFCASTINAQDVLVTDDGDAIKAYNVEVATNKVYYTLDPKSEDSKSILKSKVLVWKKADGTKVVLAQGENNAPQANSAANNNSNGVTPLSLSAEEIAENDKKIEELNSRTVKYIGKDTTSTARSYLFNLCIKPGSIISTKDIDIEYQVDNYEYFVYWYIPKIKNKTDKTIYIDLSKSFFINKGESHSLYTPSSTQTTDGSSSGIGVNVGTVASALGIGGIVGALAGGMTVGEGNSSSKTHVTYAQRVIAIPPRSSKTLESQIVDIDYIAPFKLKPYKFNKMTAATTPIIKRGEFVKIQTDKISYENGMIFTYSFDENVSHYQSLRTDFGIQSIIGLKHYDKHVDYDKLDINKYSLFFTVGYSTICYHLRK